MSKLDTTIQKVATYPEYGLPSCVKCSKRPKKTWTVSVLKDVTAYLWWEEQGINIFKILTQGRKQ